MSRSCFSHYLDYLSSYAYMCIMIMYSTFSLYTQFKYVVHINNMILCTHLHINIHRCICVCLQLSCPRSRYGYAILTFSIVWTWLLKHTKFQLVCMQARFGLPLSYNKEKKYQSCTKMAADGAEEDHGGQGHNPFMVRHVRAWSRATTVQLVPGGSAAVQSFKLKAIAPLQERSYKLTCN